MPEGIRKPEPPIELKVSPNLMKATLILRKRPDLPVGEGRVYELLNDAGIKYGLQSSEIKRIILEYDEAQSPVTLEAEVARGIPPQQGEDGRIEILVESGPVVSFSEDGRADYRNVERYRTVDAGQPIARIFPSVPGKPGVDIHGNSVEPRPVSDVEIDVGPNVSPVPGSYDYLARVHGVFVYNDRILDISEVLEIPGNVGIESGNVIYDGSVKIGGTIERESTVTVDGDVQVGGLVESGNIHIGGSLTVRKGINTRKEGKIQVAGSLKSVFIDQSILLVDQDVNVEKSIVGSSIISHGNIVLPGRGSTISGSELLVYGSITADVVGSRTESLTRITLGEHHRNQQLMQHYFKELEQLIKNYEKVADEVVRIKTFVQRKRGVVPVEKKAEFRVVFHKYKEMKDQIILFKEKIEYYKKNRFNPEPVTLTVRDTLYPGVEIHYRSYVEKIKAPQTRLRLRFYPGMEKPDMEAFRPGSG